MAHTCPNCGMPCHCNGDIDDICFGERLDCRCECEEWHHCDDDDWEDDLEVEC